MKDYLLQYKPFLLFLGKFLLTYLVLTFCYESYLNLYNPSLFQIDGITKEVARETKSTLTFFNQNAAIYLHPKQAAIKLFYHSRYVARIIEGCNAVSLIILFNAFVIAFPGKWKKTLLFCLSGSILIHLLNIFRISALAILLYYFPEEQQWLHDIVFPVFIYGIIFGLWVIWVNHFSIYAEKSISK